MKKPTRSKKSRAVARPSRGPRRGPRKGTKKRAPYDKLPKHLRSEESALVQLLQDRFGWRFLEMPTKADRYAFYMNLNNGKGGTATVVRLALPAGSALAIETEKHRKGEPKRIAARKAKLKKEAAKRAKKRQADRKADREAARDLAADARGELTENDVE